MEWILGIIKLIVTLVQVYFFLISLVGRGMMFAWPITLVLAAILLSEIPHAPRKWECRFCYALAPIGIQLAMLGWAVMSLVCPFLKMAGGMGMQIAMGALFLQILSAAYAWKKVDGYRCFFLALMLNEIWAGYWSSIIAGAILSFRL
jgi:hypothetical protein